MQTKILVVDDEKLARDRILRFLKELKINAQIETANNGIDALEKIKSFEPQIVFLDVQMPGINGFEILQQVEQRNFQLIFQTAYDDYAIKAFEESACDYLLKPFDIHRFSKALNKAMRQEPQIQSLSKLESKQYLQKIIIKQIGKTKVIDVDSVDYFISRDHYTCIIQGTSESITDLSLNWLTTRLDPKKFVRSHRNTIVAISQITSIGSTTDSGIKLKNGTTLPLSRNSRKSVLGVLRS